MTTLADGLPTTRTTTGSRRLLDAPRELGPRPILDARQLGALLDEAGLTGRGGAGFPTATKLRALLASGRRPVVVGNAMEGEPLSDKDAVLLDRAPQLVVDGLAVLGAATRAERLILATAPEVGAAAVAPFADRAGVELRRLPDGFVAGQETALVDRLDGGRGLPRDPSVRITQRGVAGRPTLVLNAETLAQLSLLARHGAGWFRAVGLPEDPGTSLFTLSGSVARPGVVELPRGTRLSDAIAVAEPHRPQSVLVGGYHGAWVPAGDLDVALTNRSLTPYAASVGAGVLHVLGEDRCPLAFAAGVAEFLAAESAGQCGPCINGLPRMADTLRRLAAGERESRLVEEVARLARLVDGRGACAHPAGTARFVASTMRTFAGHVEEHLQGGCTRGRQP